MWLLRRGWLVTELLVCLALAVSHGLAWWLGWRSGRRDRGPSWEEVEVLKAYDTGVEVGRTDAVLELLREGRIASANRRIDGPETRGD